MPATSITVVETAVEDLYRRITITPQQSQQMQEQLRCEHVNLAEDESQSPPRFDAEQLAAKQQKSLDAYYQDVISLRILQVELERIADQTRIELDSLPNHLSEGLERLRLREDAHSNFEGATFERRNVAHRALFGTINLIRTDDGTIALESTAIGTGAEY